MKLSLYLMLIASTQAINRKAKGEKSLENL